MIATLLVGTVIAGTITYNNIQDLIDEFNQYKSDRESGNLKITLPTITYTGDRVCRMNYDTEEIECLICYEFYDGNLTNSDKMYDSCVLVPYDATRGEIDSIVEEEVTSYFNKPRTFQIIEEGYEGETT